MDKGIWTREYGQGNMDKGMGTGESIPGFSYDHFAMVVICIVVPRKLSH
jgi:hypothetical protein